MCIYGQPLDNLRSARGVKQLNDYCVTPQIFVLNLLVSIGNSKAWTFLITFNKLLNLLD